MGRYKLFASPFAKVFLGAIFTYQVIYWTWLKLEMDESKFEKNRKWVHHILDPFLTVNRRGRISGEGGKGIDCYKETISLQASLLYDTHARPDST
jgi:hypothetical protein